MHRLLQRQLRKLGLAEASPPPAEPVWQEVLARVTQTYAEFDQERYLLERSLLLSSDEMQLLSANLTAERDHLRVILRSISDGLCVMDESGRLVLMNVSAARLLGWTEDQLLGEPVLPLIGLGTIDYVSVIAGGEPHADDSAILRCRDGSTFACSYTLSPLGDRRGMALVFRDTSERQRRESMRLQLMEEQAARAMAEAAHLAAQKEIAERARVEAALAFQAAHDALTGLPNRALLRERAETEIVASAQLAGTSTSLLLVDLDRFKEINDTLGHQAGDSLLHGLAQRLTGAVRSSDTVARLGGDEFAILLPRTTSTQATSIASALLQAISGEIALDEHVVEIGASVGVATSPEHGADFSTLLRCADVAMYSAKRDGGGVAMYAAEHDANTRARFGLVRELREAIAGDQLRVHYQPIVDLRTGRVRSVEALVRWQHPRLGLLYPDAFISVAENTGQVCALTRWVLIEALRQIREWQAEGHDLSVSINMSPRSIQAPELTDAIAEVVARSGVSPGSLTLEITESLLMADPRRAREVLEALRATGIKVAIDDFGTGYSSLAYLKQLPVDVLKIDRSFVTDMATDEQDSAIVRSVIELGHNLGLQIVAEGVETANVEKLLAEAGCDLGQGYHFARPVPPLLTLEWLVARAHPSVAQADLAA